MYQVDFAASAEDDLGTLSPAVAQRILKKLRWLADNFEMTTPEALAGPWQGLFRFRIGDYRVIYTFEKVEERLSILFIRHGREIYKQP